MSTPHTTRDIAQYTSLDSLTRTPSLHLFFFYYCFRSLFLLFGRGTFPDRAIEHNARGKEEDEHVWLCIGF